MSTQTIETYKTITEMADNWLIRRAVTMYAAEMGLDPELPQDIVAKCARLAILEFRPIEELGAPEPVMDEETARYAESFSQKYGFMPDDLSEKVALQEVSLADIAGIAASERDAAKADNVISPDQWRVIGAALEFYGEHSDLPFASLDADYCRLKYARLILNADTSESLVA